MSTIPVTKEMIEHAQPRDRWNCIVATEFRYMYGKDKETFVMYTDYSDGLEFHHNGQIAYSDEETFEVSELFDMLYRLDTPAEEMYIEQLLEMSITIPDASEFEDVFLAESVS